jgi:integrase/recombinase XerC
MDDEALGWIARFLSSLRNERRLSPHTESAYRRDLGRLARFAAAEGLKDWRALDHHHVRGFAAAEHRGGLSPRSVQRRLSATRSFFEYLLREKVVEHNPAADVAAPKGEKRLPRTLDADQMARLLEPADDAPLDLRDRALLELMYSSGLRLAEVAGLDLGDLDLAERMVRVTGKGRRMRIVPVGRYAVDALARWLTERAHLATAGEHAVFVSRRGTRMSRRSIEARVSQWSMRRGLGVKLHPHLFRHSFATHLLESSGDQGAVQELLGPPDIATTQVYTHLDWAHLARVYDETHPRARKRGGGRRRGPA